jgi:Cu/Ag efflux protein CusF
MTKLGSFTIAMAAALALAVTPALAQNAPMGGMQDKSSGDMQGMKSVKPDHAKMPMKHASMKHASMKHVSMKHSCMDYAWQSQDQKDCDAGSKKPPMGHDSDRMMSH